MTLAWLAPELCMEHRMQPRHPECPERLSAVHAALRGAGLLDDMLTLEVSAADDGAITRVHPQRYVDELARRSPATGLTAVDADTFMGTATLAAARMASGAALTAVAAVLDGRAQRAFCAVRPPGHHAETELAMGFCFFNSVAIAARAALAAPGIERVAIVDFDVHHGNGTVEIFADDPRVLVCSSFQHPFYPGRQTDVVRDHIQLSPLPEGSGGDALRAVVDGQWAPALERHAPQLLLISAGFDGHRDDPLGGLNFVEDDYRWVTRRLLELVSDSADGRVVSLLEGGYDLAALGRSTAAHVEVLQTG